MTDEIRFEDLTRSWLDEGPLRAPGRAVEAALLDIDATPQERDLRVPWRFPPMTQTWRAVIAAAVAVAALGAAIYLLVPSRGGPGGVAASPTPSVPIPTGTYKTEPIPVADILARLDADTSISTADKPAVIDNVLGIRDGDHLVVTLHIDKTSFFLQYQTDAREPIVEDPWPMTIVDPTTIVVTSTCCGPTTYRVERSSAGFLLTPETAPQSAVEGFVRDVLFHSKPFTPVP
jgi:hypothetical protein